MFCGKNLRCGQTGEDGATVGDEGDIDSFALHFGDTERNGVGAFRHLAEIAVEEGILHKADGVVIPDGGDHETLRIVGGCGADDLEAGSVRQEILRCVGMGRPDIGPAVGRAADNHRDIDETARHVADAAGVVNDLIETDVGETPEHQLDHRSQSHHGSAYAES